MSTPAHSLSDLRSLLASRFPARGRRASGCVPSGVRAVDEALGGGFPAGLLTEVVSEAPGSGGQTLLAQMLVSTQAARQRMALVDGADAFSPDCVEGHLLRHLVWVRCTEPGQALAAADILVRDGNYASVAIDLRGCPERMLRRTPAASWYRLQRAAESGPVAVVVQTTRALVPAVPWRLVLGEPGSLASCETPRAEIASALPVRMERGHAATEAIAV